MENTSQLLLRHLDKVRGQSLLVVNCPDPAFCTALVASERCRSLVVSNSDYTVHLRTRLAFTDRGSDPRNARFESWYSPTEELHDGAVVFLPKSRVLIEMTLTMVATATRQGATVILVGENNAGIRSSREMLETLVGEISGSDSAKRCTLYQAIRGTSVPSRISLSDWVETYQAEVRGIPLTVVSLPGVFSRDRLDDGTRLLLENLQIRAGSRILDVGCGSGVIGLTARRLCPDATVDMIDSSAYALEAARRTRDHAGLFDIAVRASDVFSDVDARYSLIVTNPPFHAGVRTDYRVVSEFLSKAASHLEPGGSVVLVANRFLPYADQINQHLGSYQNVAENARFRVYRVFLG